ncbi:MAG: hypothetical protein C4B59_07775 [Candidatus Methanogaster sp.]|uniref:Uncharacterized protein n=1 Tax=Candidatus Methanogaster sp. TaxID=3386292 RepID=A0AC61L3A9_9EURY|nr:MAG: hypothetical protein C4B59_07775 [ANME-2 cluster archaeon]
MNVRESVSVVILLAAVLLQVGIADAIIVKDADSTWNASSENISENITVQPRIIVEYPNSIFSSDLENTPENMTAIPRIIVEYSNSVFSSDLEDTPENITASPRIITEYSNSIWSINFAFPKELINDITSPIITNVTITDVTGNSATIKWNTDEVANSLVKYGKVSGSYTENKCDPLFVTNHITILTELQSGTTYYFVVNSADQSENSAQSTEFSFTTVSGIKGDLNSDGILTPADAAIALAIAATGAHDPAADVSRDGCVTSLDALMILQAAAGAIEL